jgi:hypothetical protein
MQVWVRALVCELDPAVGNNRSAKSRIIASQEFTHEAIVPIVCECFEYNFVSI